MNSSSKTQIRAWVPWERLLILFYRCNRSKAGSKSVRKVLLYFVFKWKQKVEQCGKLFQCSLALLLSITWCNKPLRCLQLLYNLPSNHWQCKWEATTHWSEGWSEGTVLSLKSLRNGLIRHIESFPFVTAIYSDVVVTCLTDSHNNQ